MPLPESAQAATLSFDAAVHRALSRRLADTPHPHGHCVTSTCSEPEPRPVPPDLLTPGEVISTA